jgi:hypothetical protein
MTSSDIYNFVRDGIEKNGGKFDSARRHLNLIGIRGYSRGAKNANAFNQYNDTIGVAWLDAAGAPCGTLFDGSCDPGQLTPEYTNAKGVAHLEPGCWWFKRGLHYGHRALVQARAVTVLRFSDVDPAKPKVLDTGFFGINLHAGGAGENVGINSAGCQVIHGGWLGAQWRAFEKLVYEDSNPAQVEIPYTLTGNTWFGLC